MTTHGLASRLIAKYGPEYAEELAMSCAFSHRLVLALRFHLDRATFTKHTERRDWCMALDEARGVAVEENA